MGTCLGIGEGMVVIGQVIAAGSCDRLQLVIRQTAAVMLAGCGQGIIELIVRVIHLIYSENFFQASFIELAIMGNEGKALNHRGDSLPDIWKHRSVISILLRKTMDLLAKPLIVLRFRMYQAVERIHNTAVTYDNHSHAAYAGAALVSGLEINCCEIFHDSSGFANIQTMKR